MYDTILLPTDGSEAAQAALDHAVDHARRYDATLHVLFVAQDDFVASGLVQRDHEGVERSDMVGEDHDTQSSAMTNEDSERLGPSPNTARPSSVTSPIASATTCRSRPPS